MFNHRFDISDLSSRNLNCRKSESYSSKSVYDEVLESAIAADDAEAISVIKECMQSSSSIMPSVESDYTISKDFAELEDKYVPDQGHCDTLGGELIRCIQTLNYRFFNDGDMIGIDYGNDTCNAPAFFLEEYAPVEINPIINHMIWDDLDKSTYKRCLLALQKRMIGIAKSGRYDSLFKSGNTKDMYHDANVPSDYGYYDESCKKSEANDTFRIFIKNVSGKWELADSANDQSKATDIYNTLVRLQKNDQTKFTEIRLVKPGEADITESLSTSKANEAEDAPTDSSILKAIQEQLKDIYETDLTDTALVIKDTEDNSATISCTTEMPFELSVQVQSGQNVSEIAHYLYDGAAPAADFITAVFTAELAVLKLEQEQDAKELEEPETSDKSEDGTVASLGAPAQSAIAVVGTTPITETDEKELRKSIIDKFAGYMIEIYSSDSNLKGLNEISSENLAKVVQHEDVFFHILSNGNAETNPNFNGVRQSVVKNPTYRMTAEEDQYFWNLNDARHDTLAKEVAKAIKAKVPELIESSDSNDKDLKDIIKNTAYTIDKNYSAREIDSENLEPVFDELYARGVDVTPDQMSTMAIEFESTGNLIEDLIDAMSKALLPTKANESLEINPMVPTVATVPIQALSDADPVDAIINAKGTEILTEDPGAKELDPNKEPVGMIPHLATIPLEDSDAFNTAILTALNALALSDEDAIIMIVNMYDVSTDEVKEAFNGAKANNMDKLVSMLYGAKRKVEDTFANPTLNNAYTNTTASGNDAPTPALADAIDPAPTKDPAYPTQDKESEEDDKILKDSGVRDINK